MHKSEHINVFIKLCPLMNRHFFPFQIQSRTQEKYQRTKIQLFSNLLEKAANRDKKAANLENCGFPPVDEMTLYHLNA